MGVQGEHVVCGRGRPVPSRTCQGRDVQWTQACSHIVTSAPGVGSRDHWDHGCAVSVAWWFGRQMAPWNGCSQMVVCSLQPSYCRVWPRSTQRVGGQRGRGSAPWVLAERPRVTEGGEGRAAGLCGAAAGE